MKVLLIILAVIAGLIALICAALSIKVRIQFDYEDKVFLRVKWLFLSFSALPAAEKKKKPKKPQKKPEEEKPPEEKQEETPKPKKANPLKTFLNHKGIEGLYEIIYNLFAALHGFFGRVLRKIRLDEFFVTITVGSGDAAKTALDYGKISAAIFPMLGYICSHMPVGRYDAQISPDFLAEKSAGELHAVASFRPIALTNAGVILVFKLLFGVAIKFLQGLKAPKPKKTVAPDAAQTENH